MRMLKMHAPDRLNKRVRILRGAIQPIKGVHFYRSFFRSRYRSLCDRAFRGYGGEGRGWVPMRACTGEGIIGCTGEGTTRAKC